MNPQTDLPADAPARHEREPNGLTVLTTYCCQGGSGMGYYLAGFRVVGVDLNPQPRYPFKFIQADAVQFIADHGAEYDLIAGSPPCQAYSKTQRIMGREHPDLISATRQAMQSTGRPWIIENVEDAAPEMRDPITLCGASFGLHTYRHRLFESSFPLAAPPPRPTRSALAAHSATTPNAAPATGRAAATPRRTAAPPPNPPPRPLCPVTPGTTERPRHA